MLQRGLKIAYHHSLMRIDHYLKDADQWRSHNSVWCQFVCTIYVVEIGVDESIAVICVIQICISKCKTICSKSK